MLKITEIRKWKSAGPATVKQSKDQSLLAHRADCLQGHDGRLGVRRKLGPKGDQDKPDGGVAAPDAKAKCHQDR